MSFSRHPVRHAAVAALALLLHGLAMAHLLQPRALERAGRCVAVEAEAILHARAADLVGDLGSVAVIIAADAVPIATVLTDTRVITMNQGLLEQVDGAQLAGVLAHEVGHLVLHDSLAGLTPHEREVRVDTWAIARLHEMGLDSRGLGEYLLSAGVAGLHGNEEAMDVESTLARAFFARADGLPGNEPFTADETALLRVACVNR